MNSRSNKKSSRKKNGLLEKSRISSLRSDSETRGGERKHWQVNQYIFQEEDRSIADTCAKYDKHKILVLDQILIITHNK